MPQIREGTPLTALPIGPFEGFLLSRMDGKATMSEIADSTGATLDQVETLVGQLSALGVLAFVEQTPSVPPTAEKGPSERPPPSRKRPSDSFRAMVHTKPPPPGASRLLYDPAELEEADVDLGLDRRRDILDAFYRLGELDHYEVLQIERSAEKADVRAAYFRLSKLFHPDTLYGKRLGGFKSKMEAVFRALTEAYDVLSKKKRRTDYDEYLSALDATRAVQRGLEGGEREAKQLELASEKDMASAVVEPTPPPSEPPPSVPPPTRQSPLPPPSTPEERRARARELMAMRMRGARRTTVGQERPASTPPPPAPTRHSLLKGLARSLRSAARITGGSDRVTQHLEHAKKSEESGDLVGAANAYRMAMTIGEGRDDIRVEYERVKAELAASMAATYEKQAGYEEGFEKWAAAALSWIKVADGRPTDAKPHRRAAAALVRAEGDLRLARDLAQRAVDLAPANASAHRTLGEVFAKAGMTNSARRELQEAAKLDPKDEIVKTLLRDLK